MTIKRHPGGPSAAPETRRAAESTVMQRLGESTTARPAGKDAAVPDHPPFMPRGINTPEDESLIPRVYAPGTVYDLPLDQVRPRPGFNPRTVFDPEYIAELAESIKEKGVLQPITVRPIRSADSITNGLVFGEDAADHFAIVMGECRWRASQQAGLATIRALIEEMDDREHRERAIIENIQRRQLNPLDEARGYQALRDLGMSVTEIAIKVGRGQPAVSKSLSLLTLPDSAQAHLGSGGLSVSQALVIKRYDDHPAVVEKLAEAAVTEKIASHTLEKGLPQSVITALLSSKKAAKFEWSDNAIEQEICAVACPFKAYATGPNGYNHYCLNPSHLTELRAERKRAEEERTRQAAVCAKAGGVVPRLSDLGRSSYEVVGERSCPKGCTKNCPCRSQARNDYSTTPVPICTDPTRFKALREADDKRRTEEKAEQARRMQERVTARLATLTTPQTWDEETRQEETLRRCSAIALHSAFYQIGADDVQQAAQALGLELDLGDYQPYSLRFGKFVSSLARYDVASQVRLVAEIIARKQLSFLTKEYGLTGALDFLVSEERLPAVWEQEERAASETVPPPGPAVGDGKPLCLRCGDPFTPDDEGGWQVLPNGVRRTEEGCLHTPQGAYYCAECGPQVISCRLCGCTDEAACVTDEGPCCWTEPDLCSACATKDELPEMLQLEVAA